VKASRRKPTESLDAYDHYLRGKEILHRWRDDEIPQVIESLERAVNLDPMFARAHGVLGHMYLRTYWRTGSPHDLEAADRETELGARLDGEDCECLSWRGQVLLFQGDFDGALGNHRRALDLKPDDPDLSVFMGLCLAYSGQADEAIDRIKDAMRANPNFPPWYHESIGIAFMAERRYEEAVKSFVAIRRPAHYIHVFVAGCLMKLGRTDEARASSLKASKLDPYWVDVEWAGEFKNDEDNEHEEELARLALEALQHEG
jgi:tetratricopeptide (TPR) repeat protein